jgi:hypothetical protein
MPTKGLTYRVYEEEMEKGFVFKSLEVEKIKNKDKISIRKESDKQNPMLDRIPGSYLLKDS